MGFLSAYSNTRKIPVGDPANGYWVELKECLNQGEKEKAEKALVSGKMKPGQKDAEMSMDIPNFRALMLLGSVKSWNLDDDNGQIWAIDLEHIKMLPTPIFDQLWELVDDMNKPASSEEKKTFRDESVGGNPDGDFGRAADAGDVLA